METLSNATQEVIHAKLSMNGPVQTIKKHAITNAIQFVKNSSLDIEKALT